MAKYVRSEAEPLIPGSPVLAWEEVESAMEGERFYWLATIGPDSRPHVRPVLAVFRDGAVFSTTAPAARKGRNLKVHPQCALSARSAALDIVLEGSAHWITDTETLEAVAGAYAFKYGWPVTVVDSTFDAPYGAPTAGPPPYAVYEIRPSAIFAFTIDDPGAPRPTRWVFR